MRAARRVAVVVFGGVLACTSREQPPADTSTRSGGDVPTPVVASTVTARGIGPLQVGMNLREARGVLPGLELPPGSDATGCEFAKTAALPGVLLMVDNGVVVRVDVDTSAVPTAEGVRVGDPIARARSVY